MSKKIVLFGEYLLRLTPPAHQKLVQADSLEMHWAGSEANIAVSLSILGEQTMYITAMPENELARAGISQLHKYGVETDIISHDSSRVGTYYYESGVGARPGRVIYDRDYSAFSLLTPGQIDWQRVFKDADWFHWSGIIPALNQNMVAITREALKAAKQMGLQISADFNYRSTLWQYGLSPEKIMPELLANCDTVLADVNAAKLYFKIDPGEKNPVESCFDLLQSVLKGARYMAMTMRANKDGNLNRYKGYLWSKGSIHESQTYGLDQIAERIGAGDAFMAGLIHGIRQNKSLQDTIEFATACGVIKHSIPGDFNIASRAEIESIIRQSGSGRIIR
jgi:2-dehydro-3-deoxygluconokinase